MTVRKGEMRTDRSWPQKSFSKIRKYKNVTVSKYTLPYNDKWPNRCSLTVSSCLVNVQTGRHPLAHTDITSSSQEMMIL